jgi:imidazolonepropionase-like amidohydrolase
VELVQLTEARIQPRGSTRSNHQHSGAPVRAGRGRIAPGQPADLLLVRGDPTTDITATSAIAGVWRRGARL